MNSLMFYVDENDYILNCVYYENFGIGSRKEIKINLPDSRLHNLFFDMIKNNPKTEPISNKSINIFNFYDVDVNMIDKLISESEKFEKIVPPKIERNKDNEIIKENNEYPKIERSRKVRRINRFKKTFITTSASVLAVLSLFTISKKCVENMGIESFIPTISFNKEAFEESKENYDFFENLMEFKDNASSNIELYKNLLNPNNDKNSTNINVNPDNTPVITELENSKDLTTTNLDDSDKISVKIEEKSIDKEKALETEIKPDGYLKISTDNLIDSDKYTISKAYYSESLGKYAKQYGIDSALALAIGTHERGIHNDQVDSGGAVGLFQIQVEGGWNWDNKTITAYNFETNEYEEVLITKDSVSDVFMNMQVGCMMLQNLLVSYDYNVAEAVTAYNYGSENVRHVLETCSKNTGLSMNELNDINNMDWLKYRDIIKGGDPEYLENVFKYIPNGSVLSFTKPNYENVNIEFDNLAYQENKII